MTDEFCTLVQQHLRIPPGTVIGPEDRLREYGLDSLSAVQLVLVVEEHFGVQLPDTVLVPETFVCLASLWAAAAPSIVAGR